MNVGNLGPTLAGNQRPILLCGPPYGQKGGISGGVGLLFYSPIDVKLEVRIGQVVLAVSAVPFSGPCVARRIAMGYPASTVGKAHNETA